MEKNMLFKKALKDINDLLKHEAVDNNNLLTGHRINHKTDLEQIDNAKIVFSEPAFKKPDNFRIIQEEITRLSLEKRKTPVIIIDEANYINNTILNDLKILFNFEMDSRDRAAILLAGLPKLNSTLGLGIHEPLRQRIVMNYNLEGLSKDEGKYYISEKLKGAGCNQTIFEDAAVEAILNAADGTPRLINKFCNASMLIGDSHKANLITTDIVMQAINDCELG